MLAPEHLAGAAESGDHLVDDEDGLDLIRDPAKLSEISRRRNDIAVRSLDRLDNDRSDIVCRLDFNFLFDEIDACPLAIREGMIERTAAAVRVRRVIDAVRKRPEAMLEIVADQAQHAERLTVEPAPEADDFGLRQAKRCFDRFRPAAIVLGAAHTPRA